MCDRTAAEGKGSQVQNLYSQQLMDHRSPVGIQDNTKKHFKSCEMVN